MRITSENGNPLFIDVNGGMRYMQIRVNTYFIHYMKASIGVPNIILNIVIITFLFFHSDSGYLE